MPNCPDCKGIVELELVESLHDKDQQEIDGEEYYRCPVCRTNFEPEYLDDD